MKYSVLKVVNGNFSVAAECSTVKQAIVNFHSVCTTLWNASDVESAAVIIVDEKLNLYNGKQELIVPETATTE
jgi:hypothetical protein